MKSALFAAAAVLPALSQASGITLDLSSTASIKSAAQTVAKGMLQYYTGNQPGQVPGNLPQPYYWWECGAMFGSLIDYWQYTNDSQFNAITTQALLFQVGPNNDYMPPNRTKDEGNDDQAFWGMAAISAAEANFPNPPSGSPSWIALGQAVFNTQVPRWDPSTCAGGLRWQIFTFNSGYNYKNSISNGCFFNMAARLGRYTGNQTYLDWAEKMWGWTYGIGLVSSDYHVYDGSDDTINCTQVNHLEWTYNAGVFMYGAAIMWNVTQSDVWKQRLNGLIATSALFFDNGVMKEVACEDVNTCDTDQKSFKAYLARWMAATTKVAPFTASTLMGRLQSSAKGAIGTCTGGSDGQQCGLKWTQGFDGSMGVGEQMSVLEVVQSNLAPFTPGPLTQNNGGSSVGNAAAGGDPAPTNQPNAITGGDKAGAGILTTFILIVMVGGAVWMALK